MLEMLYKCNVFIPKRSLAGILVVFLDVATLVEFLSIGTLFSYTTVCVCLLLLRYQSAEECPFSLAGKSS